MFELTEVRRGDRLAQWLERWTGDTKVEGSNLCLRESDYLCLRESDYLGV